MRRAGVAMALLALVSVSCAAGDPTDPGGSVAVDDADATTVTVVDVEPLEVRRVVVASGGSEVALVRSLDGTWLPESGDAGEAPSLLKVVEQDLFPLVAYRGFAVDQPDPLYGLSEPVASLVVEDHTDRVWRLAIGGPTFAGGGFYARLEGRRQIYLLARATVSSLAGLVGEEARLAIVGSESPELGEALEGGERPASNPWLAQAREAS